MAAPIRACVSQIRQTSSRLCANLSRLTLSSPTYLCSSTSTSLERTYCTTISQTTSRRSCLQQPTSSSLLSRQTLYGTTCCLHTSSPAKGFEEFFETKKNIGEDKVKSGREWKVDELRLKDNVTLHKLWYVLLKERNMLLTMEEESIRADVYMPSPERYIKVEESMANLKQVLKERDEAVTELKTGQTEMHPGKWVKTVFGYRRFVRPKEYLLPIYMNKYAATKRKRYGTYMTPFISKWLEKDQKIRVKRERGRRWKEQKLRKRFPDSDVWQEN